MCIFVYVREKESERERERERARERERENLEWIGSVVVSAQQEEDRDYNNL